MAIPKSKRTTTPLSVLVEADTLACYTILICTDESRFPKRYRWCLTQQIIESAVRAKMHIAKANSVYVNDHESATLRRTYQQEARSRVSPGNRAGACAHTLATAPEEVPCRAGVTRLQMARFPDARQAVWQDTRHAE